MIDIPSNERLDLMSKDELEDLAGELLIWLHRITNRIGNLIIIKEEK